MNTSALFQFYAAQTTRAGEYHGWKVAETIRSVEEGYNAAKNHAACLDSTFRGRLSATGKDALDLLHRLSTNALLDLQPGRSEGTILLTDKGRILDFVTVFHAGDSLLLLVSPSTENEVRSWIEKFTILEDISVESVTSDTVMASFLGPEADSLLSPHLSAHPSNQPLLSLPWGDIRVIQTRFSRTPEIHMVARASQAGNFWNWLVNTCGVWPGAGQTPAGSKVPMIGSSAYEAYRITEGLPMSGSELVQQYNPYDVNLKNFISYTKGCYIGQEVIARLDTYQKSRRNLAGLVFRNGVDQVIPGAAVFAGGEEMGRVTSSTSEPLFGARIGLAVLRNEAIVDGGTVTCSSAGGEFEATVHTLPMEWPAK